MIRISDQELGKTLEYLRALEWLLDQAPPLDEGLLSRWRKQDFGQRGVMEPLGYGGAHGQGLVRDSVREELNRLERLIKLGPLDEDWNDDA